MRLPTVLLCVVFSLAAHVSTAQIVVEPEASVAFPLYIDVAVPNDATRFSLTERWTNPLVFAPRLRVTYLRDRHEFSALAAPLRINGSGMLTRSVDFVDSRFVAGRLTESRYRFDSYRATYRYLVLNRDAAMLSLGATMKLRSAAIELRQQPEIQAEKTDVGVVPLIAFRLWVPVGGVGAVVFEGDALAAPQGRAADVLLAFDYETIDGMIIRLGGRLLEGGADVDEVYNFSAIGYAVLGVRFVL